MWTDAAGSRYGPLVQRRRDELVGLTERFSSEVIKLLREGLGDAEKMVRLGFFVTLVTTCAALIILVSR